MPSIIFGSEAFSPKEIARRIRAVVFTGNLIGAAGIAVLVYLSGHTPHSMMARSPRST